ncbi:MAG: PIG-L family deacetylase [Candidatus Limnocylindrales bacterium]
MTHVFVSPHPDEAALSCGGLIAAVRARGESVALLTIFCGPGALDRLTPDRRLALGFGREEKWQPGDDAVATAGEAQAGRGPAEGEDEPPTRRPESVRGSARPALRRR